MGGPVALVGRERELSWLMGALDSDVRLVLVVGDAGVGKTRFAGEAMSRAAAAGLVMARGECLPLAGTLPLLPVASALDELARLDGGRLMESALAAAPAFARAEATRLVPHLAASGSGKAGVPEQSEGWQRGRLFAGTAELLAAVAGRCRSGLGLLIEDVHWADSETLDFITFLSRAGHRRIVRVVVTCRSDEAPLRAEVTRWLAQARGTADVEEIRLGPLSRAEVAGQAAGLAGGPVPAGVVDELFVRAEGNPFFTEQLVAAALLGGTPGDALRIPPGLPARLADVLAARADRCADEARTLLDALAVIGRPADEDLLGSVTGSDALTVRRGLRKLADARLLADNAPGGRHWLRHALLAEAVAGRLLPGQRASLHERTAQALATAGSALAGEAAGHWQAAGRPDMELPARAAAAAAAERVFGYAEAAGHWQRAIALWPQVAGAETEAGIGLPQIYVRAIDAVFTSGDTQHACELAEEVYRRCADHPDPGTAAIVRHRAAFFRSIHTPAAGRPLLEESLRLFEQAPPSVEHARARFDYALSFRRSAEKGSQVCALLHQALQTAEAADATALAARVLTSLAHEAFMSGQVETGQSLLDRARTLAEASQDGGALLRHAVADSDVQLKLARFRRAAEVAVHGVEATRQVGLEASWQACMLAWNGGEALLALGRVEEAAALIGPLTIGPPDHRQWVVHEIQAEIDMLRGDTEAGCQRLQQVKACFDEMTQVDAARELAQRTAELELWAGAPGDALSEVQQVLPLFPAPDWTILCGRLLATGMRACADQAGQSRARRDLSAAQAAVDAADGLAGWVDEMGGAPFADHPFAATIPAERAIWEAERTRLAGESDATAWARAAKTWDALGCPHRAGYALWRQAQAQLDAGEPATAATITLRAAATAADGHEPLLAQIRALAERARIPLRVQVAAPAPPPAAEVKERYGLTARELAVLRLVAAGRTNSQIGAELFISQRTAGVHVTNILRKLGVSGRVQAATLAERAGLL